MANNKHTLSLDATITAHMIGFPAEEQKTMTARELGEYMGQGYMILQICYEDEAQP